MNGKKERKKYKKFKIIFQNIKWEERKVEIESRLLRRGKK